MDVVEICFQFRGAERFPIAREQPRGHLLSRDHPAQTDTGCSVSLAFPDGFFPLQRVRAECGGESPLGGLATA